MKGIRLKAPGGLDQLTGVELPDPGQPGALHFEGGIQHRVIPQRRTIRRSVSACHIAGAA